MSEEVINKVRALYDNVIYFPNKVLEIFNDFFGELMIDMQGFWSFNEFLRLISENNLRFFFYNESDVLNSPEFKDASKENRDIIEDMLHKGALDSIVTSDEALATYFLPIMTTAVSKYLSNGFILVYFPSVKVTNEYDKFVNINKLWVKVYIKINGSGMGYFTVNRSEYEVSHIRANYLHSHVPSIPLDDFSVFKRPCIGNGPIKNTITSLAIEYDEALWRLFCLELDRYVRVESISGKPYKFLENIGSSGITIAGESDFCMWNITFYNYSPTFCKEDMRDFIKYLIKNKKLKFNFIKGNYGLAMSYLNYRILISNEFIDWYNLRHNLGASTASYNDLVSKGILKECVINNGKIQYLRDGVANNSDCYQYEGAYVCTFKGKPVTVHILDSDVDITNKTILINSNIAEEIAKAILTIVNYKYGREERKEEIGIGTTAIYL